MKREGIIVYNIPETNEKANLKEQMYSITYSTNIDYYLLMPGAILCAGDTVKNKTNKRLAPTELGF